MALEMDNLALDSGLVAEKSYHRVENFGGSKNKNGSHLISYEIKAYVSREAAYNESPPISVKQKSFTLDVTHGAYDPVKQCYFDMKKDDFYASARDVLE